MKIQNAQKEDAEKLAYLINLAGEGIPFYLWSMQAEPGEDPFNIGVRRALREEGGFSYRNARVIRDDSGVVGMILSYQLDDPYIVGDLEELPEVVRPLDILESKVPGSWYVNAVASMPSHRGQGIATQLLNEEELRATLNGVSMMSVIVASENQAARQLYLKLGYELKEVLPVVECPGGIHGGNWELMTKDLI